jgi:hypothetical protein
MVSKLWTLPFALSGVCLALYAQQPPPPAAQAPAIQGLQAPWDIRQMLTDVNAQNQKLKPLLDQMHPQQWLDNGAPPTYASQYIDTRSRLEDVVRSVANLAQHTDSLSAALDAYFRMEALEVVSRSLLECIQKYGEHTTAQQLSALIVKNYSTRQKFRDYLRDLSVQREQECKIADEEAQRCRGIISKEPPPSTGTRRSR